MAEDIQHGCSWLASSDIDHFLNRAAQRGIPLTVTLELTHRCNFRCVHCYLGDQEAIHKHRSKELDTEKILSLLDELVDAGTLFLTLTGGDPMLRPDFVRIYEYAVHRGLLVSVYCNGSLITDEIVNSFIKYPPRIIEVTLYGATEITFESITQQKGSFAACMNGVARLLQSKNRLRLKTMVMSLNYQEMPAIRNLVQKMGVGFRHDCAILPALPNDDNGGALNSKKGVKKLGLQETLRFRISPQQAVAIDHGDKILKEKIRQLSLHKPLLKKTTRLYKCAAGRSSFHITPYGRMQPCIITLYPFVDLLKKDNKLLSSWESLSEQIDQQRVTSNFICTSCVERKKCTGCPSSFLLESGCLEEVPSFYCDYTKCR
ncbi:MAG: radical SAM protein [Candidatus Electrothrix aestuarii]|uniref:Radical SAM protein n=1 Tax=Candidatus Electrothrix aestuarii TaxID=3062594 RepID=A0AAU8LXN4_9BACT|nr:radical SAM protein [Candidatus Electrothrix aestuarii]